MAETNHAAVATGVQPMPARLVMSQTAMQLRLFFRRPVATFFVIALPVLLLGLFATVFGDSFAVRGGPSAAQFYAPSLAVFGALSAAYTYLAVSTAFAREAGVFKRVRTAPLPLPIYLAGRIVAASLVGGLSMLLVTGIGVLLLDVELAAHKAPAAIIVAAFGLAACAACAMATVALVDSGDSAQAVTSAVALPLSFISGVFIHPSAGIPDWLLAIADLFPIRPFARAFTGAFDDGLAGAGLGWNGGANDYEIVTDLAQLMAWTAFAILFATYAFKRRHNA